MNSPATPVSSSGSFMRNRAASNAKKLPPPPLVVSSLYQHLQRPLHGTYLDLPSDADSIFDATVHTCTAKRQSPIKWLKQSVDRPASGPTVGYHAREECISTDEFALYVDDSSQAGCALG